MFFNEQGMNTTMTGPVPHDENIVSKSILRKDFVKTTSATPTTFTKSFPKYTIAQLKQKTGYSDVQLAQAFSWVWKVVAKDDNTNCVNLATDVVVNNSSVKGEVYINGILS